MGLTETPETLDQGDVRLFFEERQLDTRLFSVGGGALALYSSQSPAKDTPNEDAAVIIATGAESAVLAVADGLGGAPAGRQAAAIAVECLAESVRKAGSDGREIRSGNLNGIETANETILALSVGAATTLTAVEIDGPAVRPFHVGDSFMLVTGQRGKLKSQTIPHSPTGYAVESGLLDAKDAMYHEDRHVISNVLGSADMRIDVGSSVELAPKDTLVLASDGLSDNLHMTEVVELVRKGPLDDVTRRTAELARTRMEDPSNAMPSKPDDLTFAIFRLV